MTDTRGGALLVRCARCGSEVERSVWPPEDEHAAAQALAVLPEIVRSHEASAGHRVGALRFDHLCSLACLPGRHG